MNDGAGPPYRWDLVTPDRLGTLLAGADEPDLWFLPELVECTGRVVARAGTRSGHGDLVFVGRSLDSMFDLLGGALAGTALAGCLSRLPLSFVRGAANPHTRGRRWRRRALTSAEIAQARRWLTAAGVDPYRLARRTRPLAFVDVVHEGGTFTELYGLLRAWIDDEPADWRVIRRKVRFIGVTRRQKTSPNAYRWQDDNADWTRDLPAEAVVNVSIDPDVWSYLGNFQPKLTRSHRPDEWLADGDGPGRDERTRAALAEAVALDAYGRSRDGRRALAAAMHGEPALAHSWLRSLVTALNR
jgi:hypothetical protein